MTPRVTVAIAFHNEERFLANAIASVLGQSFADFELLLVDDGSTDRSREIARRFAGDARVRLISDGRRRHLGARLNEVTKRARGELIARMDGDDVMHPRKLELQIAHLDRTPECHAVGTWAALATPDDVAFAVIEALGNRSRRATLDRPPIPHATMVARAGWLAELPYDETLTRAEDRDLWCRAAGSSRIDVIQDVLYVIHASARSPDFLADYHRGQADLRRVVRRYGPRLAGLPTTARLVCGSLMKSAAMSVAVRVGLADRLVLRRGRPPTRRELDRVDEALRAARSYFP